MQSYDRRSFLAQAAKAALVPAAASIFSAAGLAQAPAEKGGSRSDRELMFLSASQQRDMIVKKEISAVELTQAALRRIEALDGKLHAFITVDRDGALQAAKAADAAVRQAKSPQELGPLHGVPISIKDLEMTKGLKTTFGSQVYKDFVPDYDSIVVERVRKSGAVILGKTNSPEFGLNAETYNKLLADCGNPWDPTRTAGGSSGGAAASVAAGICAVATASDGGGSTRIPAHFTGTYGIKVTLGRIPRYGGVGRPAVNVTSNSGPIARTVRDATILLQVLSGHDSRDPSSLRQKPPDFLAALKGGVKGMKVGWSVDMGFAPVEPDIASAVGDAVKAFSGLGAEIADAGLKLDPPPVEYWAPIWYSNVRAAYGHLMDTNLPDLMPYVVGQIHRGTQVTGADYSRALRLRDVVRTQLDDYFEKFDLLLLPSVAVTAFPFRTPPKTIAGKPVLRTEAGLSFGVFPFTPAFNLSGHPAASIPCGFDKNNLPIGLQIVGPIGNEAAVLRASAAFEEAKPWVSKRPPVS